MNRRVISRGEQGCAAGNVWKWISTLATASLSLIPWLAGITVASAPRDVWAFSISGTICYQGTREVFGIGMAVWDDPCAGNGGPVAGGRVVPTVDTKCGTFDISVPGAGPYYLGWGGDVTGDGRSHVGGPGGFYKDRTYFPLDPITAPAILNLEFSSDSHGSGIAGTATYIGNLGPVSESRRIVVRPYSDPGLTKKLYSDPIGEVTNNGGRYDILPVVGDVYLQAFLDLNGDHELGPDEPFTLYGVVVTGSPTQTNINFTFGNEQIATVESRGTEPTCPARASSCVGDCNDDDSVTVDELLKMVNVALGNASVDTCSAGDGNHDGKITIDEILAAVNNALNGCPG
jgi:hypothetical protein